MEASSLFCGTTPQLPSFFRMKESLGGWGSGGNKALGKSAARHCQVGSWLSGASAQNRDNSVQGSSSRGQGPLLGAGKSHPG